LKTEEAELIAEHDRLMDAVRAYTQGSDQHDDYGEDAADRGTDVFEQEKNLALADTMTMRLEQVRHALERMDEGLYGICEVTGDPIPIERLEAMPSATTTVEAASRQRGRI
jgi:RNA polymerase-binding transcription factor DksA